MGGNGIATGITSTDIGVSQTNSTPLDTSLQLTGTGNTYQDFSWTGPSLASFGAFNSGQSFGGPPVDTAPTVDSTTPANSATNVAANSNISVTFSEPVNVTGSAFTIECPTGTPIAFSNTTGSGPATSFTLDPTSDLPTNTTCSVTVVANQVSDADADDPPDNLAANFSFSFTTVAPVVANLLVINEIDYDQPVTDNAEFVEIKNNDTVAVNLDLYSLVFVNGNGGAIYRTIDLPNVSLAAGDYYVVCGGTVANCDLDSTPDTDWAQNGAPDAVALLLNAAIVDTVSYEGDTVAPYTEGTGAVADTGAAANESISRCPDGVDTNQNNTDFGLYQSTPGATNICVAVDPAPTVSSTSPANGATGVGLAANIDITFSEAVNVTGSWFTISCANSGAHTATVSGGPTSFTLNPDTDFSASETCGVTVDSHPSHRPGYQRPARHHGRQLQLQLHHRRRGPLRRRIHADLHNPGQRPERSGHRQCVD